MKIIRAIFILLLTFIFVPHGFCAKPKTRILFIGNSLTFTNDLPQIIADVARVRGFDMEFDMYAPGGYSLRQHCEDGTAYEKIKNGPWDFIVLQERGILAALPKEIIDVEIKPYLKDICRAAREANPNVKIVVYAIPVRKDMDDSVQQVTDNNYTALARESSALVAPVGRAWSEVRSRFPSIEIYSDGVHPNINGSYLMACVFFSLIFHQTSMGLPRDERIDAATAASFQAIADKTMAFSY